MNLATKTITVLDHAATGARARKMRDRNKKSLREVAKKMRISAAFLSDLERGRRNWTEGTFNRFKEALR